MKTSAGRPLTKIAVLSFSCALLAAIPLAGGPVIAQQKSVSPESIASKRATPATARRAKKHWTRQRLRQAKPLPIPMVDPGKIKKGALPKSAPNVTGNPRDIKKGTSRISGDSSRAPFKWAGKLSFTTSEGDFVCSGQFITSRIVLTAAHCVRDADSGEFYDDFLFQLQYNRGNSGEDYDYECVATKNGWVQEDSDRYSWDFAMILVKGNSSTGNIGYHYGWPDGEYRRAAKVGYPADILNGEVVQIDQGELVSPPDEPGILELRHGNPRNAGGSSGGQWIGIRSDGALSNYVISVTSHHRGDNTAVSYGPRFNDSFKSLLDYVNRGCN